MTKFKSWNQFITEQENKRDDPDADIGVTAPEPEKDEYRKLLDFIKGKKTVDTPAKPPANVPKGWFVVDEATKYFWHNGNWAMDPSLLEDAIIDSEKGAIELSKAVGGVVIPAEEIL